MRELVKEKLLEGEMFTAARGVTLASGGTASVAIENPSGSDKTIVIDTQEVQTDSAAHGTYYRSPDVSSATAANAANDLVGSSDTTVANVSYDGSYSNSSSTTNFPITETGADEAGLADRPPLAIQPGESIAMEVTADASDCDVLFLLTFYEVRKGT